MTRSPAVPHWVSRNHDYKWSGARLLARVTDRHWPRKRKAPIQLQPPTTDKSTYWARGSTPVRASPRSAGHRLPATFRRTALESHGPPPGKIPLGNALQTAFMLHPSYHPCRHNTLVQGRNNAESCADQTIHGYGRAKLGRNRSPEANTYPGSDLKRVIVTPAVYPRFIEFLHFDIQSTGQKSHRVNTHLGPSRCFVLIKQSDSPGPHQF